MSRGGHCFPDCTPNLAVVHIVTQRLTLVVPSKNESHIRDHIWESSDTSTSTSTSRYDQGFQLLLTYRCLETAAGVRFTPGD